MKSICFITIIIFLFSLKGNTQNLKNANQEIDSISSEYRVEKVVKKHCVHPSSEVKLNCECCHKHLPKTSTEAMICSYGCTFCVDCVVDVLEHVCPNCSGSFVNRLKTKTN